VTTFAKNERMTVGASGRPETARRAAQIWLMVALSAIYFTAGKLGLKLAFVHVSATAFWPPTGIALAAYLTLGYRVWPGIFVGAFLVNLMTAGTIATSIGIAAGNTLEGLVGAYLVNRLANGARAFDRPQDTFKFAALAVVSTMVSATLGVTSLSVGGVARWSDYGAIWLTWWLGDACGALTVAPPLLLWTVQRGLRWRPAQYYEAVVLLLATVFLGLIMFCDLLGPGPRNYPPGFVCIPLVAWAAFRFEQREAATVALLLSAIAVWGTRHGSGPFVRESPNQSLLVLQAFMGLVAVMAVALAAAVSERKHAEQALRTNEERLRLFVEHSPAAIAMLDRHMRYMIASRRWLSVYRLGDRNIIGRSHYEVFPNLPDYWKEIHRRCLAGAVEKCEEDQFPRADGTVDWVHWEIRPWRDTQGEIGGLLLFSEVITERRQADERFRLVVESAPNAMVMVNQEGKIVLINSETEKLFGYSRNELIGQSVETLVPEPFRHSHPEFRKGFYAEPRARPMGAGRDLFGLRKDGSQFPVEIGLNPIQTEDGVWVLSAIVDITARKRAEEQRRRLETQIEQAQKLESLGILAGGIAHDFNNLLTGIMGNTSLALETLSGENPARRQLQNALSASERASQLTRQLLAYAGKGRFLVEPVNLSALVREIAGLIEMSISKNVQITLQLNDDLPRIEADSSQVQQVVMNLVINGAEAIGTDKPGTVRLTTATQLVDEDYVRAAFSADEIKPGTYVTLEVCDTGSGMDEQTQAKIFDPFFTTKFTGRGLGLAAVLGIVRGHKGALRVYSTPGLGSTFKVLLPAAEITGAEVPSQPSLNLRGTGTILVVDDEEIVRRIAKSMLEQYGYTVLLAADGRSAIDLYRSIADQISLVLLDLTMPTMSGDETLKELMTIRADVRVLLSSGYDETEIVGRFNEKGIYGFIQKPYTAPRLAAKVKDVLEAEG
jgi:PAS domain S-box-containing protein